MNVPFVLRSMRNLVSLFYELTCPEIRVHLKWLFLYLFMCNLSVRLCQTLACGLFQFIYCLCEGRLSARSITQHRAHLKDLSEWTTVVKTETLVFSLSGSNDPNMSSRMLETTWNIADTDFQMGSTRLRLLLGGDKFQALQKCWDVCLSSWIFCSHMHPPTHSCSMLIPKLMVMTVVGFHIDGFFFDRFAG